MNSKSAVLELKPVAFIEVLQVLGMILAHSILCSVFFLAGGEVIESIAGRDGKTSYSV